MFENKIVVVTGAARGIGKSIAKAYASEKAMVYLADIKKEEGLATKKEMETLGFRVEFVKTDIGEPAEVRSLFARINQDHHRLDILVNNAGISKLYVSPLKLEVSEWDRILNTNLRGAFLCAREAALLMQQSKSAGSIINIASTRAFMSEPGCEAYAASKGGLVALTHALAVSLAAYKITVNAISPGWIMTGDYEKLRDKDHQQHPAGRVGKPDDIARACFYLSHPDNNFVTGENLVIDGGMTRKMIYEE
ncbi:MAG: SDR family NAD(P)-dependent oxidoreductase [Cyclobacteriaceae bacterium]